MIHVEREITQPVDLTLESGRLNPDAVGWTRRPLHRCALPAGWPRRKRWEFWGVLADTHLLRVTYGCTDYIGTLTITFLDTESGERVEHASLVPLAWGMDFPDRVAGGDIRFSAGGARLDIVEEEGGTRLRAHVDTRALQLEADVFVALPAGHETLGVVIPWAEDTFQYTAKHNSRPASGFVRVGHAAHVFSAENNAFGILDFGRGVWPYDTAWNWAAASGVQDGRVVGFNLGGKWTDGTGMTENAVCVDGRLAKVGEDLVWEYDRRDFRRPWRICAPESRLVDVRFTPAIDEHQNLNLFVVRTELHWCLGTFSGFVVSDAGERVEVRNLPGWAEEHLARW